MRKTINKIIEFREQRDWNQFHNPKDLAISLTLEASELLENFQWKDSQEAIEVNYSNMKDEIADILIYTIMLAEDLDIDIEEAINQKLDKNNQKYPVEKAKGSKEKYTKL